MPHPDPGSRGGIPTRPTTGPNDGGTATTGPGPNGSVARMCSPTPTALRPTHVGRFPPTPSVHSSSPRSQPYRSRRGVSRQQKPRPLCRNLRFRGPAQLARNSAVHSVGGRRHHRRRGRKRVDRDMSTETCRPRHIGRESYSRTRQPPAAAIAVVGSWASRWKSVPAATGCRDRLSVHTLYRILLDMNRRVGGRVAPWTC